jgi:RNA polymerase sigma-70 factor (ECF subfamily)
MNNRAPKLEQPIVADEVLAQRASLGNTTAFGQLVARHSDAVYTIARNVCGTADAAEQAVQEAFLTVWRDLGSFPSGSKFTTWLYRIATRAALARRASDSRRTTSRVLEAFLPAFDADDALVPSHARWPELERTSSQRADILAPLQDALECFDDQTRAAFVLRDLLDLRVEEAAAILDLSPNAVRRLAHRARLLLRGFIDRLSTGSARSRSELGALRLDDRLRDPVPGC